MGKLRGLGVDVLVSTLTQSEEAELELLDESSAARTSGLNYITFPIMDRNVPDALQFRSLVYDLHTALHEQLNVAIHCRMGIGRSSLVAAGVLMLEGLRGPEAWATVADARGLPVPDTEFQRSWLQQVAETW
jgi:protein-tyrosine phosphatase